MNEPVVDFEELAVLIGDELTPDFISWFNSRKFPRGRMYGIVEHLRHAFGVGRTIQVTAGEVVPHLPRVLTLR